MRHRQHTGGGIDRKCRGGRRSLTVSYIVAAPIIHMVRSFHSHLDDCQYEGFLLGLTTSRYPDETAYVSMCNMATASWKKKNATSVVRPARSIKDSIKGIVRLFKRGCVKDFSVYLPTLHRYLFGFRGSTDWEGADLPPRQSKH